MKKLIFTLSILFLFIFTLSASNSNIIKNKQELKEELKKELILKKSITNPTYLIIKFNIDNNGNFKLLEVGPTCILNSEKYKLEKYVEKQLKNFNKKCIIESKDYSLKINFK